MTATEAELPLSALPVETLSPAEERFERFRKRIGLVLAPLAFVTLLLIPMPSLKPEAHRLAAIMAADVREYTLPRAGCPCHVMPRSSSRRVASTVVLYAFAAQPLEPGAPPTGPDRQWVGRGRGHGGRGRGADVQGSTWV